jgi:hypothetical protein
MKYVIAIAVAAVAGGVAIGLRVHHARIEADNRHAYAEHARDEARTLIAQCENRAGLANSLAMATSKFGFYIATGDRANPRRVMVDVIAPLVSAYELACSTAKTDIEIVAQDAAEPDSWIDVKGEEVAEQIKFLAGVRAAVHALDIAVDAAPNEVVMTRLDELATAAKPVPIVLPAGAP